MIGQWAGLFGGLILAWAPLATLDASELPAAVDLRAEASAAARAGGPLIVVFGRRDCQYCETVKRDYLQPLAADPRYRDRVRIRQVDQGSERALTDFTGAASSHASFAAGEKIQFVPVVAFYGPDGSRLAEPIVGARLPDFYPGYLEDAIDRSARALSKR